MEATRITTIFCGNPGGGKSTLLNSFFGRKVFESGVSIGKRLTTVLQTEKDSAGNNWADTPGLNDPKIRDKAAAEISKGLKLGGLYRLVFVVLIDAGRVRPEDKVTMSLILDAAKIQTNNYGIIVNKVPKKTKTRIESSKTEGAELLTMLTEGMPPTQYIYLNPSNEDLVDEQNVVVAPDPELLGFLSKIPTVGIDPSKVEDIKADKYEGMLKSMREQLQAMADDNKRLLQKHEEVCKQLAEATKNKSDGGFLDFIGLLIPPIKWIAKAIRE